MPKGRTTSTAELGRPVFHEDETVDRLETRLTNQQATLDLLRSCGVSEADLALLAKDVDLLQRRVADLRDQASRTERGRGDQSAETERGDSDSRVQDTEASRVQDTEASRVQDTEASRVQDTEASRVPDIEASRVPDTESEQPEATLLQLQPVGPALAAETDDNLAAVRLARLEAEAEAQRQSQGLFALAGCGVGAATAGIATAAPELAAGFVATAAPVVTSATATVAAAVAAAPFAAAAAVTIPAVAGIAVVASSTRAPEHWVPDSHRTTCTGCDAEFGVLTRKHHCRGCGEVFCNHCAPPRPQSGERACAKCGAAVDAMIDDGGR